MFRYDPCSYRVMTCLPQFIAWHITIYRQKLLRISEHSLSSLNGSLIWYRHDGMWRVIRDRNGIRTAREHRNSLQIDPRYIGNA